MTPPPIPPEPLNYGSTGELKDNIQINTAPQLNSGLPVGLGSRVGSTSGIRRWDGYIYEPRITAHALRRQELTILSTETVFIVK